MTDSDNQDQDVLLMDEAQVMLRHLEDLTYSNHPDYPSPEKVEELRDDIKNRIREINRSVGGDSSTSFEDSEDSESVGTSGGVGSLMPDPDAWRCPECGGRIDFGEVVTSCENYGDCGFHINADENYLEALFAVETIQETIDRVEAIILNGIEEEDLNPEEAVCYFKDELKKVFESV